MTTATIADTLVIAEHFGPTFQGEGRSLGIPAAFIRLGGCNLTCSWCDSAYTWSADRYDLRKELTRTPVLDILAAVDAYDTPLVVITGGEPLLHQHQPGWYTLLDGLTRAGKRVEVETNGTLRPDDFTTAVVDGFNVSPKLAHSGVPADRRIIPDVLRVFLGTSKAVFKWVCRTPGDVDTVAEITADLGIPSHLVWVMPEGRTAEVLAEVTDRITDRALHYRFCFTPRLHIQLWGNARGR